MLTKEQSDNIREQIHKHIESTFPEEKKESALEQLFSMTDEELEQFLQQNGSLKENEGCIFCSIILGEIPSYKIYENEKALAVLEINPISRGHIIIIPKTHDPKISGEVYDFSKKLSEKISLILKPKKMEIIDSELFGHKIINLLPIYLDENIHSKKQKASEEELKELQKQLSVEKEVPQEPIKPVDETIKNDYKTITENDMWLPRRIP